MPDADAPLPGRDGGAPPRVSLLYRRGSELDERILSLLETELTARGFRLFVDRRMQVGVAWAVEIERQIRQADAVIPLLSEASLRSEMLEHEIVLAHRAAQEQGGERPRLLPVRLGYEGPLPPALAGILDPVQYLLFRPEGGRVEEERLVAALVAALRAPATPPASGCGTAEGAAPGEGGVPAGMRPAMPAPLEGGGWAAGENAGGAVPLGSAFYVERATDVAFRAALARQDSLILIKGARQMGKTSLLARGLREAREARDQVRVALLDLQTLSARDLENSEALYRAFAETLAEQLDLPEAPAAFWNPERSPAMNLERYLRRGILNVLEADVRLVWALDEVDRLFTCPFGSEVFGLFRSWHNRRSLDPEGPWGRLTLAIAYATEAHLFITDLNQSPFNVGTRLTLDGFVPVQVAELNRRYGEPLPDDDALLRFHALLGGQPYLTRRGLDEMATRRLDVATFEALAGREDGIYGDHLRRILISLSQDPLLLEAMRAVLSGKPCPTADAFYRLRSAGVLAGDAQEVAEPRCRLYAEYLTWHLLGQPVGGRVTVKGRRNRWAEAMLQDQIARAELEADRYRRQASELAAANQRMQTQNEALLKQAGEDPLTGLANRRQMTDWLHESYAAATSQHVPVAVALVDADYFKQINDRFSHPVGDKVLRTLAALMRAECPPDRPEAVRLSRFGGEEFLAILHLPRDEALAVCERIRSSVERYDWESVQSDMTVTVSIGVCADLWAVKGVEEVLALADQKLYEAKRAGRNRVAST